MRKFAFLVLVSTACGLCLAASSANALTLFSETFSTDTGDAASTYGSYGWSLGAGTALVADGVLILDPQSSAGQQQMIISPTTYLGSHAGNYSIQLDLGESHSIFDGTHGPGWSHVYLGIGENHLVFHPGFNSPAGAFRVEGPGGFTNQSMGFVPAADVLHHMLVHVDTSGLFTIEVTDGSDPSNVYSAQFENLASVGGELSLGRDGRNGSTEFFDNLLVTTTVPEPSTALLLGVGLAGLGMRRRRTRRVL